jgi:preprotein translocase subunit Sss1
MRNVSSTSHVVRQTTRAAGGWLETLARCGYATKGVVYVIVGILAVMAAIGAGGATKDSSGAIETIAQQPFGRILVGLTALGLIGYVIWRFIQAMMDPEHKGSDAKGIATRIGYAVSGIAYASLAFLAGRMALSGGGGGGSSNQELTARLMSQPFGIWLVGIVGAIVIGVGIFHFYHAYKAKFMEDYKSGEMSATQRRWAKRIGRFGLSARGVTFVMIGSFFIIAALNADPSEAKGLSGALDTLARQPYGPWLLGIVSLGLVAYGVYCFSQARYRRISTSGSSVGLMSSG